MSVAVRNPIPPQVSVLLSPQRQSEIVMAALRAEQRTTRREHVAENAARQLQWIETELDQHARSHQCPAECSVLRSLRRQRQRMQGRYQESLKQLRRGR